LFSHAARRRFGSSKQFLRARASTDGSGKVYSIAAVRNVAVMLHSFYDGPGLLAAIHTAAALGAGETMIEWRAFDLEA
jgi:hypothetical protein